MRWVTSLAPIMITQMSGTRDGSASACVTCRSRSSERAPGTATVLSPTGRSAIAATPDASSAPGVWPARCTPCPAAVESPSIVSRSAGSPGTVYAAPYRPSAFGTRGLVPLFTRRRASCASASSRPTVAAPARPMPPPPYAAPAAIRRATRALDMPVMPAATSSKPYPVLAPYGRCSNPHAV